MQWHRELIPEDVDTARRLLDQHQPMREVWRGREREVCCNALHMVAPVWPCDRVRWAQRALDAADRGEVTDGPAAWPPAMSPR